MNKRKKNKKIKKTKEKGYLRAKEKCVSQFNIIRRGSDYEQQNKF